MISCARRSFCRILAIFLAVLCVLAIPVAAEQKHVMIIHIQELTDDQGGDYHVYGQILAYMKLDYKVTYVYLLDYKKDYDRTKIVPLEKMGVIVVDGSPGAQEASTVFKIKYLLMTNKYESVVEFLWQTPQYLTYLRDVNEQIKDLSPSTAIGVLNADIFHERMLKEYGGDISKCPQCDEYKKLEMYFWKHADVIIGVNDDLNVVAKRLMPTAKIVLLPYCELVKKTDKVVSFEKRSGIVYYGHNNTANAKSVAFLVQHISPELLSKHGTFLHVYGQVTASVCIRANGCIYHGPVTADELNEAIMSAKWMMAPIFTNVGISTKILRALGLGTPVITTKEGTGGMEGITDTIPMVIADIPDYAKKALEVYNSKDVWDSFHKIAQPFIEKHFSMDRLIRYTADLQKLTNTLLPPPTAGAVSKGMTVLWDIIPKDSSPIAGLYDALPHLKGVNNVVSFQGCPAEATTIDVFIRAKKVPSLTRPACCPKGTCVFIVYLPWDWGYLPSLVPDKIFSNVDFVWALTSYNARMFISSGVQADIIRKVPFGVNCEALTNLVIKKDIRAELGIAKTTTVFSFSAGVSARRGLDIVINAFQMAFEKDEDVTLLLFLPHGSKQQREFTDKLIASMGPKRPVKIASDTYEPTDIYGAIDVLIHPVGSVWSLAPLEALAAGKIVFITENGAMTEYFGRSPFLFTIWGPDSLLPFADRYILRDYMKQTHGKLGEFKGKPLGYSESLNHEGRKSVCDNYQWTDLALNLKTEIFRAKGLQNNNNKWRADNDIPSLIKK